MLCFLSPPLFWLLTMKEKTEPVPSSPPPEMEQGQPPSSPAAVQEQSPADEKELESHQERILTSKKVSMKENKEETFQESEVWEREDHILETLAAPAQINHSFRYSAAELTFIRDVVYEAEVKYKFKLGKGEVLRIALLWLMYDYQASKQDSFLVRLLTRKKTRK